MFAEKRIIQDGDVLPQTTEPPFCQDFMRRTTQQTLLVKNLASQTENNKALLFLLGKETVQTFSGSI